MGNEISLDETRPVWLILLPEEEEWRRLMFAPFCGLPFLTRQMRIAANAGASDILIVSQSGQDVELELVRKHRLSPPFDFASPQESQRRIAHKVSVTSLPSRVVVQHAAYISEASDLRELIDRACPADLKSSVNETGNEHGAIRLCRNDEVHDVISEIYAHQKLEKTKAYANNLASVGYVHDRTSLAETEHKLWEKCRKSTDGIVSAYINRSLSLPISRLLVSTFVSPNQVTVIAFLLGIAGVLFIASLEYWMTLAGAIFLKLGSIVDGVDGELARMRVQSSVVGEWLDTISDDAVSLMFVIALGYRSIVNGSELGLYLSVLTAIGMTLVSAIYYKNLSDVGRGDILIFGWFDDRDPKMNHGFLSRAQFWGGRLFRRDLLIALILVLAVFDAIELSLLIVAPATVLTLLAQLRGLPQHKAAP
ncbi:MAG: CDP-alcohol phosphatidyltransferase family protein [Alphaproteobacteria bacterium]|nr:CDP-alcohol phosphatidyltransferase family protein [Alphaproteobacteria bacterium]